MKIKGGRRGVGARIVAGGGAIALALTFAAVVDDDVPPASAQSTRTDDVSDATGEEVDGPEDNELLMLMDASESMSEKDEGDTVRIEAARDALHGVVGGLDDSLNVGLRVFSGEVTDHDDDAACTDSELVQEIASGNRDELDSAIDEYDAVGARTPISYALEQAAEDLGDEGQRTIVLVSDGEENCAPDPCVAASNLADKGVDVAIHAVGYNVDGAAREQLECIADAGNGEYFDATDGDQLKSTLARLSQRAFQPFMVEGEEVDGAANIDSAPTLEPGQYVDQWSGDKLFYRIPRTTKGSSIHVGLTAITDEQTTDSLAFGLGTESTENWELFDGAGAPAANSDVCVAERLYVGSGSGSQRIRTNQVSVFPGLGRSDNEDCDSASDLILVVEPADASDGGNDGNDFEGQSFEMLVEEEAPVGNLDNLPDMAEGPIADYQWEDLELSDSGEELMGGNSFNNAPELNPGESYDSEIYPGETVVYKVPVEWGQQLQAQVDQRGVEGDGADNAGDGSQSGDQMRGVKLQLFSPRRGAIDHTSTADGQEFENYGTTDESWQDMTHPVRWKNREGVEAAGFDEMKYVSTAGDYYVMISRTQENHFNSGIMPITLTTDAFGEVEGEPEYDTSGGGEPGDANDAAQSGDESQDDSQNTAQKDSGTSSTTWAIIGASGVLVVILVGAGIFLLRRYRR